MDVEQLTRELEQVDPLNIICESFEYRPYQSSPSISLVSRDLIGVVQLFGKEQNIPVFMQTASQGKGYYTNEKLKELGLYVRGQDHARDATRHLLYWFTFKSEYQYNVDLTNNKKLMRFQMEQELQ